MNMLPEALPCWTGVQFPLEHRSWTRIVLGWESTWELLLLLVFVRISLLLRGEWTVLNLGHPTGGCMLCWCLSQVMWPRGHGVMDRASACGACSPWFGHCNIQMFFLLRGSVVEAFVCSKIVQLQLTWKKENSLNPSAYSENRILAFSQM